MGYGVACCRRVCWRTRPARHLCSFAAYQGGEQRWRTLPLWLREELEKLERKKQTMERRPRRSARG
ncbi:hypothetical protein GBAR_LOCUS12707, partial [Geodia barretti]